MNAGLPQGFHQEFHDLVPVSHGHAGNYPDAHLMTSGDGDGDLVPNRSSLLSHELPGAGFEHARGDVKDRHPITLFP